MDLYEAFPEDPFEPTIKYVGINETPFTVPWAKGRVQLGSGLNTQRKEDTVLFLSRSAFKSATDTPSKFRECQTTSIKDNSGTNVADSSENTNFAISASVGGSFLGASGRGSYEKTSRDNKNTSSISVCAEHVCGQVDIFEQPRLDIDAVKLLRTSHDPINDFRQTYGDFYLAGYRLGAVNGTTVTGHLASKAFHEAKRAELEVKALFVKIHKSINDVVQSGSSVGGLKVLAFDSLTDSYTNFTAYTVEDSLLAADTATQNKQMAMMIAKRATGVLFEDFSLSHEGKVDQDTMNRLCDRGLVTELLLAPFASLREYQSLLWSRRNNKVF